MKNRIIPRNSEKTMRVLLLLMPVLLVVSREDDSCADAPHDAVATCRQITEWDQEARKEAKKVEQVSKSGQYNFTFLLKKRHPDQPIEQTIYDCMNISCMCDYLAGREKYQDGVCYLPDGRLLRKTERKEYRLMTDDERNRFHSTLNILKANGEYDQLSQLHTNSSESGPAHAGPAFLPWHREFIKRVEIAIRRIDPSLYLPYWDSRLDQALSRPQDSIIFTKEFMGETDSCGYVTNGPFRLWKPLKQLGDELHIKRNMSSKSAHHLFTQDKLDHVLQQGDVKKVLAYTVKRDGCEVDFCSLEYSHGCVHIFVGGHMNHTSTAANDPIFFLHHGFVDFIWEQWRLTKQTRVNRETQYPSDCPDCANEWHLAAGPLQPFGNLTIVDGLSNKYTDNLYTYAASPTCTRQTPDCSSKYLFCDLSHGTPRCSAKIKLGAECSGYSRGENPCHNGTCSRGRCRKTVPSQDMSRKNGCKPLLSDFVSLLRYIVYCISIVSYLY